MLRQARLDVPGAIHHIMVRLLDDNPIPDLLRYRVLKETGGRCSLCGATKDERPLDIDHIIPRSQGGKTD